MCLNGPIRVLSICDVTKGAISIAPPQQLQSLERRCRNLISSTHMLFEHQVLDSLHDELGACVHHSGQQPAEGGAEGGRGAGVRLGVCLLDQPENYSK